jgi:hypothetical protein
MRDYFHLTDPVYGPKAFYRRCQMSIKLFVDILDGVREYEYYFEANVDAIGKLGFSSYKKCSTSIRQLSWSTR